MVVGTGVYRDHKEAFPLDKKTLTQVAWRSFFTGFAKNGETSESIGWLWAILPGLKKIHENEEDLAFAKGHHLEYVKSDPFFTTFAMGVILAMEQQKMDPMEIRSIRTTMASIFDGLSKSILFGILLPCSAIVCSALAKSGNLFGVVVYALLLIAITVCVRLIGIRIGYQQGVRFAEKMVKNRETLTKAVRFMGVFMVGALSVIVLSNMTFALTLYYDSSALDLGKQVDGILPGAIGVGMTMWMWYLLTKKQWSLTKCALVIICIAFIGAIFGLWPGTYEPLINIPLS